MYQDASSKQQQPAYVPSVRFGTPHRRSQAEMRTWHWRDGERAGRPCPGVRFAHISMVCAATRYRIFLYIPWEDIHYVLKVHRSSVYVRRYVTQAFKILAQLFSSHFRWNRCTATTPYLWLSASIAPGGESSAVWAGLPIKWFSVARIWIILKCCVSETTGPELAWMINMGWDARGSHTCNTVQDNQWVWGRHGTQTENTADFRHWQQTWGDGKRSTTSSSKHSKYHFCCEKKTSIIHKCTTHWLLMHRGEVVVLQILYTCMLCGF